MQLHGRLCILSIHRPLHEEVLVFEGIGIIWRAGLTSRYGGAWARQYWTRWHQPRAPLMSSTLCTSASEMSSVVSYVRVGRQAILDSRGDSIRVWSASI